MTSMNSRGKCQPRVVVQFSDGAHWFHLPKGATLMELAGRIDDLAGIHDCAPIAVRVGFEASDPPHSIDTRSDRIRRLLQRRLSPASRRKIISDGHSGEGELRGKRTAAYDFERAK